MKKFDLLVIGSGPAASRVSDKCAEEGWSVAIAESRKFGGTCALRGCNPKKVFVRAAEVVDAARRSDGKLCNAGGIAVNWPDLMKFKRSFTDDIPNNSRESFEGKGIRTYLGSPKFVSPTQLTIGDETIEPKHVLIATGAKPRPLEIEGEDLVTLSDQFMELQELPKSIVFIGGGYISFEFAHVAARADSKVTILERENKPLGQFEQSIVDRLVQKSEQLGVTISTNAAVKKVEQFADGKLNVTYEKNGKADSIIVDLVVHGAGRVPSLDELDLETGNVEFDSQRGVIVDEFLRSTSNSIVHAAGDCAATDVAPLTPTANAEAFTVAKNLLGNAKATVSYGPVPAVVFTVPPLASVGLTEEQARKQEKKYRVEEGDMSNWGSVKKVCESTAAFKILIEKETDHILGVHLIGPGAAEAINLFAVAMKFDIAASELKSVLMAFPTFTSDIRQMI